MASEKYARYSEIQRQIHPNYTDGKKGGLFEASLDHIGPRDDYFFSNFGEKAFPWIRAGRRAWGEGLNQLRWGKYYEMRQHAENAGIEWTPQINHDVCQTLNHMTGHGDLPGFAKGLQKTCGIFFAPRLKAAQIEGPFDVFRIHSGPAWQLAARTYGSMALTTAGMLALAHHFWGDKAKIGYNPYASDFGKLTSGNTQVDLTGGQGTLIRTLCQAATGEKTDRVTGETTPVDRKKVIARWLQSGLSPHAGLAWDLFAGKTYTGQELTGDPQAIAGQVYERMAPIFVDNLVKAAQYDGANTALWTAPLAWHGIRVQTYPQTAHQEEMLTKNNYAKQYFNSSWDDLGPESQKALRQNIPSITQAERKSKVERMDYAFTGGIDEGHELGADIQRNLPYSIQSNLKYLNVAIPGISRKMGADWKLNDQRFQQYQNQYRDMVNKALVTLYSNPEWNRMTDDLKQPLLDKLFEQIKGNLRMDMITQASIHDIELLRAKRAE